MLLEVMDLLGEEGEEFPSMLLAGMMTLHCWFTGEEVLAVQQTLALLGHFMMLSLED